MLLRSVPFVVVPLVVVVLVVVLLVAPVVVVDGVVVVVPDKESALTTVSSSCTQDVSKAIRAEPVKPIDFKNSKRVIQESGFVYFKRFLNKY